LRRLSVSGTIVAVEMNADPISQHTILLNGAAHALDAPISLAGLLDALGLTGKPVVCEVDGRAVLKRDHTIVTIHPGSRIEIVTLAAGG
jgi:sulfur carrier protein